MPPKQVRLASERYASCWNAFLLPAAMKLGQGNVFTGVCDSVNRGGLPQCMLGYQHQSSWEQTPRSRPPSRHTPQSRHPPGTRHPPGPDTPLGPDTPPGADTHPPEQTPPREADSGIRSTSGRYASYWNAFLFHHVFVSILNRILYATAITNGSLTGSTHVPVLLSGMNCDGDEVNIQNCEHDGWTSSGQCDTHPAGVLCIGILDLFRLN